MKRLHAAAMAMATSLLLMGCSTAPVAQWNKAGASAEQRDQDLAECKYDAAKATTGDGKPPKSTGDAVGQGVARGMEEADLIKQCMQVRGYSP